MRDAGIVVMAEPKTNVVIGVVAQPGLGASMRPTNPAVAKTVITQQE
jgi:hypothetical protein